MTSMFPRMFSAIEPHVIVRRLLHEMGNGRALENARRERDEHEPVIARIDALCAGLQRALPAAA